jgi:peptidoglycan/xylan/chitin deacetylase (PgdA/CDA1 family)
MYLVKTPRVIKQIFPSFVWDKPNSRKEIFLTFDDGPIADITPWVIEQLEKYNAKATFFCVGDNVRKNPLIYDEIITKGHSVGNHTFNHFNGWHTGVSEYVENIERCAELVDSSLFRPPYGKISRKQTQQISDRFSVIMWDILSGDFDPKISKEACLHNVISNTSDGSIIVFHDNIKAWKNLEYALPRVLKYFSDAGYTFGKLNQVSVRESSHELELA